MEPSILIPKPLVDDLKAKAVAGLPNEVGGFLLGSRTNLGLVISEATGPYRQDRLSRTTFRRLDKQHSTHIMTAWKESETKETLLGDWHSHTSSNLEYSNVDRKGWETMLCNNQSPMVGLIVNANNFEAYSLWNNKVFTITRMQKTAENPTNILFSLVD